MRPGKIPRHLAPRLAATFVLTMVLLAVPAFAQNLCNITGPSSICGGTADLCGPQGSYDYTWSGPSGFSATTRCITVSTAGNYTLSMFDWMNGISAGTCSHMLSAGSAPSCSIDAPASPCAGQPAQLCGPAGSFSFVWSGPSSFAATTQCITVSTSGLYSLTVTDPASGCSSAPCTHDLEFTPCGGTKLNCPRPAFFWWIQCAARDSGEFNPAQMLQIAKCVDERSGLFSWSDAASGLCSTLRPAGESELRKRARRQFAALLANVCAGELNLTGRHGETVQLDLGTIVTWHDAKITLASWIDQTDADLAKLDGASLHRHTVRAAYREIIAFARRVNHGLGIGDVCPKTATAVAMATIASTASPADANAADEVMADAPDAAVEFDLPTPNPFSSSTSMMYSIADASGADVDISVLDIAGRRVASLVRDHQAPGRYEARWDGRQSDGRLAKSGAYLVRGRIGSEPVESRILLLR